MSTRASTKKKARPARPTRPEARLRQLANEQKTILNTITAGICLVKNRKLEWVNPAFASMSGWTEAELRGAELAGFYVNPDDYQRVVQEGGALLAAGKGFATEVLMKRKDGTPFWCHLSARAIKPRKVAEGSIWVARDVTERRQADEALRASESKLAEIFRVSPELISVSTLREGRYLQVNDAFTRVLGYTREEVIGHTSCELGIWQSGDERDRVMDPMKQLGSVQNVETRIRKKSGAIMDVLLSISPLNIEGQPCLVTVATDITERKLAEDASRASESKLAEIFRTSPSFLSISTLADGRMLAVNDAAVRMMGYAREEIIGRTSWEIGLWPAREERARLIRLVRERGQIQGVEARMCRKSGEVFDVLISMTPLDIEGQSCLVTGIVDIAGLKRAEQALRQSEVLLRATLDSIEDGVLVVSATGRIAHYNARFLEIWSIPPELAVEGDDQTLLAYAVPQLADPDQYAARVQGIYRSNARTRDTVYFKDGRIIERFSAPVDLPGAGVERLWVFRDVTARVRAEAALRDREAKLSSIIRAAPVGIGVVDNRIIREVNEAISQMTGYSREELAGQSARVLYPTEEEFLSVGNLYAEVHAQGKGTMETRWQRKDGAIVNLILSAALLDPEEPGRGITFIAVEITKRKQAEAALRENEERLRLALLATNQGLFELNFQTGRFIVSEQFAHMLECELNEVKFTVDWARAHVHPDDLKLTQQAMLECITGKRDDYRVETRMQTKGGDWRWILTLGKVVERDTAGKVLRILGTHADMTERHRAEAALQESEQKFRTLFEHMAEGVAIHEVIFDGNGVAVDYRILDVNPAYGRHTGLTVDKARGRLASDLYGTGSPPYLAEWLEVARTGKPFVFETYFAPMQKHFHISVVSPKPGFFATVFEDVTGRIQREEELRRKNEELERFTYTVSHDLKSPLITIKGFAGALLRDAAAGRLNRLEEDLKRITSATDKMAALLNDLLELSRIGRMMNPPTDVQLDRVVQDVLELLAGPLGQRAVQVIVQPGLPTVQGDRRRLSEVFQNLIENAVRFLSDQPQPRIEIGARGEGADRVFYVRDNGIGIEPRYHETVFGLFNKLDARTPGTGIGLALVRRIIEVHGGKIWVESEGAGHGATFCFSLPPNPPIWNDAE